ncbi:uncharacterized protein HMPREF1541_04297 [Cyphellophora europaea CBS 101466]|uniref:Methyltransferase type 11 domain-containing protein n=1 Tax=Cyphellophora europaea (strain CBS 101466) TaxID=1220924 RepID=W2RUA6_CYPE1|nr:uncharacterized protein HMPREF1541_04297 [Cyphellophora europaea CBS 101466]ETN40022.1 hypothetical protein HMPREF1541_04297 [Cyphellophora europaea CBS 101466]
MPSLLAYVQAWQKPITLIGLSLFYLWVTLLLFPITPSIWFSFSRFRDKWFGRFWKHIGPQMAAEPVQDPYIHELLQRARGVVLELGPGTGDQSRHYNPAQIELLYGAEPNKDLHEQLLAKSAAAGIGRPKYRILNAGAEPGSLIKALKDAGLINADAKSLPKDGIFDTIVAVKSMCSMHPTEMTATVAIIHALLKHGGEFLFFEHVHSDADPVSATLVKLTNLIWPYLMGNCHLDSKLDKIIQGTEGWAPKDIRTIREYQNHHAFRYVYGRCRRET